MKWDQDVYWNFFLQKIIAQLVPEKCEEVGHMKWNE